MEGLKRQDNISEEKEIDLLALGKKIWLKKKFILKVVGIGFIFGLVVAFSIPKEYTTTVVLLPDTQSSSSGTLSSLASLAGINLGGAPGTNALATPDLYPDIVNSSLFSQGLLNIIVMDSEKKIDTTLYAYLNNYQSAAWWNHILGAPRLLKGLLSFDRNKDITDKKETYNNYFIPKEEQKILDNLKSRLAIGFNKKTGITTIDVTMQSPEISAYIADTLTSYLQSYIIDYRTQKTRQDLEYAQKLYQESKENYYKAQKDLAVFIDGNLNVVSASFRTTQERLQNEVNLAYSVYNQTAQQLQLAKIKVQDNTPVFTVIQPAVQPLEPSKPSKKLIMIVFLFLSLMGASAWVLKEDLLGISKKNTEIK